jgi:YD repeat-containing protein
MAVALLALVSASGVGAVEYAYDSLNRLTWVKYASCAQITYSYDAAGNLTYLSQAAATATVPGPPISSYTASATNGGGVTSGASGSLAVPPSSTPGKSSLTPMLMLLLN